MIRALALAALMTLAACGFTPVYGDRAAGTAGQSAAAALNDIAIDIIPNAEGVALRNHLIDRFYASGYPASPRYRLSVAPIVQTRRDLDLTVDAESTARRLTLTADVKLIDLQSGEAVLTRNMMAYASYNVLGSQFTTRVSEADAREAALSDLARQIETQIALYFNR